MAVATAVLLNGDDLTLDDVWSIAVDRIPASLSDEGRTRMAAARELVDRAASEDLGEHTYGINTGFGRFVSKAIPPELSEELQLRLLRSHACGVGEPYPDEVVRAAMLLRANALAKGYSGARVETVELLLDCLNKGVLPVVPSRGSVGASGDLAPLAHLALPLIGEGSATFDGEVLSGADALARAGLEPTRLQAKEGLSLINGTQFMGGVGALALVRAGRIAKTADIACALSLEALQGSSASFIPEIHALRPLAGQAASAANVLRLLEGSAIIEAHRWCDKVQDAYSLRCAPQVHGASRDLLAYAEPTVAVEVNAATDNPLVLVERDELVSNGNFHGQPLAFALDAHGHGARRARVDLRAPRRAARQPVALRRAAGLPHARRRTELRLHDPAVRRRRARQREQGALPSGERGLDPDERRPGGSRLNGERGGPQVLAVLANVERALAIELLAAAQGDRVPRPARARGGRARGTRLRSIHLADADRGSPALGRHRARRGGDPHAASSRCRRAEVGELA